MGKRETETGSKYSAWTNASCLNFLLFLISFLILLLFILISVLYYFHIFFFFTYFSFFFLLILLERLFAVVPHLTSISEKTCEAWQANECQVSDGNKMFAHAHILNVENTNKKNKTKKKPNCMTKTLFLFDHGFCCLDDMVIILPFDKLSFQLNI